MTEYIVPVLALKAMVAHVRVNASSASEAMKKAKTSALSDGADWCAAPADLLETVTADVPFTPEEVAQRSTKRIYTEGDVRGVLKI